MAKAGFWLQGAKGKLAGTILQKGEGGTIQRIATDPKNPQTNRQMMQRIIFATVAQAARYLRPVINNSFEGIADPALAIRHFRKINCDKLRSLTSKEYLKNDYPLVFFTTKRVSTLIPNRYIISQGSMSAPEGVEVEVDGVCKLAINVTIPATINAEQVTCKKLDALKLFGIDAVNEQITVVAIEGGLGLYQMNNYVAGAGMRIVAGKMKAARLVPDPGITAEDTVVLGTYSGGTFRPNYENLKGLFNADKTDAGLLGSIVHTIEEGVEVTAEDFTVSILMENPFGDGNVWNAMAVIKSAYNEGAWKYSTTEMQIAEYDSQDFGLTRENAIEAWFEGKEVADDGKFLSQGGDVNAIN